jgi:DNA-binding MarR family transcriptional regulator
MAGVDQNYGELCLLIERLSRQLQETRKSQLDRHNITDITSVQVSVLRLIGEGASTPRMLMVRGCYLGATLTYNLKSLVENGYLTRTASADDKRSVHLALTGKGRKMWAFLQKLEAQEAEELAQYTGDLEQCIRLLRRAEEVVVNGNDRRAD